MLAKPAPEEVAEVVRRIESWRCVEPDERAALRRAVGMLPITDWEDRQRPVPDRPMRVAEVAALLNVSRSHVRDMIRAGTLRAIRLSDNPRSEFRVPESAVREFLDGAA